MPPPFPALSENCIYWLRVEATTEVVVSPAAAAVPKPNHMRWLEEEKRGRRWGSGSWAHWDEHMSCLTCLRGLGFESVMFGKLQNHDSLFSPVQKKKKLNLGSFSKA